MVVRITRMAPIRFRLQRQTERTRLQSIGRIKIQAVRRRGKRSVKMRGSRRVQRGIQDKDSNFDNKIEIDRHSAERIGAYPEELKKQEYVITDRDFEKGPQCTNGTTEES
jgi:hypothetical protein